MSNSIIGGEGKLVLVHRGYDKSLTISADTPHWVFDQSVFFNATAPEGVSFDAADPDEVRSVAIDSYSQGDAKELYVIAIDSWISTSALEIDDEATAEIAQIWGADVDAEGLLCGEVDQEIEDAVEDGGWHIQRIRSQVAARAGYNAVQCWDEQGTVYIVDFSINNAELNQRLTYIGEWQDALDGESVFNTESELIAA